jgi:glycosyltransferase involved in cell wall biosynthesis
MGDSKKILVFHHSGAIGGGSVSMLHILRAMKSEGYDVKLICPAQPSYMLEEAEKMGIEAEGAFDSGWVYPFFNGGTYNIADPRYIARVRYIKKSREAVRALIAHEAADIVVFNSMTIAWMGSLVPEGTKTVCFDRETLPFNGRGPRCAKVKRQLAGMTKSVFLSEFDAQNAGGCDNFIVITDKVDVAKLGNATLDPTAKCSRKLDFDKRSILYCGGMWRVKGSHTALQMMHHLNEDYQLIFMQYEPKPAAVTVKTRIKRLLGMHYEGDTLKLLDKIEDRVKFFPPQGDMVPFYAAADIVIFPSTKPHQARPVYEAGAACKPCVISDFPNTAEFAKDGVNVLTFEPGNSEALADCIERLCDRELYYRLADNGHRMCLEHHNIETLGKEIADLLKSLGD